MPLADRLRRQPSKLARRVRLSQGTLRFLLGDRLTVGRLPLKQVMEVRFLLPELPPLGPCHRVIKSIRSGVVAVGTRYLALNQEAVGSTPTPGTLRRTEAIRPDEEPVLKTGGGPEPLVSSSLTASALMQTQSRGLAAKAALSHGEDRRCESVRDYSAKRTAQVKQLAEGLGSDADAIALVAKRLRVRIPPWALAATTRLGRQRQTTLA